MTNIAIQHATNEWKHESMTSESRSVFRQTSRNLWLICLSLLSLYVTGATAQEFEICACSPSTYQFTFDFTLTCPPVNITASGAVTATSCLISPFGDPDIIDLVPVAVQSIDILELGQDLRVLVQENIAGNFADGDSFVYSSITSVPDEINEENDIPRAIQLNVVGVNRMDEPIINVYIITFSNDCNEYPVLVNGQSAGWTVFNDLTPPRREFCPLSVGPPTDSPTSMPTPKVTAPPTDPLQPPTKGPTPSPTMMSFNYDMRNLEEMMGEFGLDDIKNEKK